MKTKLRYPWEKTDEQRAVEMAAARAMLVKMPSGIGMTCGKCGHFGDMPEFIATPVYGDLPVGQFQCPACQHAFTRENRKGWIELRPCTAMF
jgi:hypothetical protein